MECEEICSDCPWGKSVSQLIPYLNDYLEMQDGGCQPERHELLNEHWKLLGYMKNVREAYGMERAKTEAAQKKAQEAGG